MRTLIVWPWMAGSSPAMGLEGIVTDIANDLFHKDIKKRREETPSRRFSIRLN
jgi:hypothetical protein